MICKLTKPTCATYRTEYVQYSALYVHTDMGIRGYGDTGVYDTYHARLR